MEYNRMDLSNWNRREHYLRYMKEVVCFQMKRACILKGEENTDSFWS